MSGHTPGPWRAERDRAWGHVVRSSGEQSGRLYGEKSDVYVAHRLRSEADARLIAVAPEMYAILSQLKGRYSDVDAILAKIDGFA